jgi:hypothetical protein
MILKMFLWHLKINFSMYLLTYNQVEIKKQLHFFQVAKIEKNLPLSDQVKTTLFKIFVNAWNNKIFKIYGEWRK